MNRSASFSFANRCVVDPLLLLQARWFQQVCPLSILRQMRPHDVATGLSTKSSRKCFLHIYDFGAVEYLTCNNPESFTCTLFRLPNGHYVLPIVKLFHGDLSFSALNSFSVNHLRKGVVVHNKSYENLCKSTTRNRSHRLS